MAPEQRGDSTPPRTTEELVASVCDNIISIQDEIRNRRAAGERGKDLRGLYNEKGYNVLLLLMARKHTPIPVRIGLKRRAGKELHPFSQNGLRLHVPMQNQASIVVFSAIDSAAKALDGNSRTLVEQYLSEPDYFIEERPQEIVDRLSEEAHEVQRAFREMPDAESKEALDELKLRLVEEILSFRNNSGLQREIRIIPLAEERQRLADVRTSPQNYIRMLRTPLFEEIVEKYGGYDQWPETPEKEA